MIFLKKLKTPLEVCFNSYESQLDFLFYVFINQRENKITEHLGST